MTRAEIDSALAALAGLAANPPAPRGDSYLIAALARVVIDQERRLRVLENTVCDGCGAEFGMMHTDGCSAVTPYLARAASLPSAPETSRMLPEEQAEAARLAAVIVGAVRVKLARGTPLLPGENHVAEQIRRAREPAIALLRDLEWCNTGGDRACPVCSGLHMSDETVQHVLGCKLAALIKEGAR